MDIGIDLGGSHVGVGLVDGCELKAVENKVFSEEEKANIENAIIRNIEELISKILNENNLSINQFGKIGLASPGTIKDGKITSYNLGLNNFDLKSILTEKYNLPVIIRNDGKCAALAEKKYGSMQNYEDCVFVNIGTGIGGAAFIGGKLLEPKKYSGFEFGHMTVEKNGIECTCGKKGCFERYASIKSLKNRVIKRLNLDSIDISGRYLREEIIPNRYSEIEEEINDYISYLKIGICNLIDIFEPEVICFGGSFSYYGNSIIFNKFIQELDKPNSTFNKEIPKIVMATFTNDAGIIGSVVEI